MTAQAEDLKSASPRIAGRFVSITLSRYLAKSYMNWFAIMAGAVSGIILLITVSGYNGRGIGPGTVFGKLVAEYLITGDDDSIPLPLSRPKPIAFRSLRGLYYETGARLYHLFQRRF